MVVVTLRHPDFLHEVVVACGVGDKIRVIYLPPRVDVPGALCPDGAQPALQVVARVIGDELSSVDVVGS